MQIDDLQAKLSPELPYPIACHVRRYEAGIAISEHQSPWGELSFALNGVMEYMIEGQPYLSPPQYALWIPPDVPHKWTNHSEVHYVTLYIAKDICANISAKPCTATLSALLRAIVNDFSIREVVYPQTPEDLRLAQVFIDQLRLAPTYSSYLPWTADVALASLLSQLQQNPGDKHGASYWAEKLGMTERTLLRHCQKLLGVSFNEWRQRLKLVSAMSLLDEGWSVQHISTELGYSTPSAFISMFQRLTGMSPERMRKTGYMEIRQS